MARLISWHVAAMLAEFDAGAFERTAMQAGGGAFDDAARGEGQLVEALHEIGVEEFAEDHRTPHCGAYLRSNRNRNTPVAATPVAANIVRMRMPVAAGSWLGNGA